MQRCLGLLRVLEVADIRHILASLSLKKIHIQLNNKKFRITWKYQFSKFLLDFKHKLFK